MIFILLTFLYKDCGLLSTSIISHHCSIVLLNLSLATHRNIPCNIFISGDWSVAAMHIDLIKSNMMFCIIIYCWKGTGVHPVLSVFWLTEHCLRGTLAVCHHTWLRLFTRYLSNDVIICIRHYVPSTRGTTVDDWTFPVAAVRAWNVPTASARTFSSYVLCRWRIKMLLFKASFEDDWAHVILDVWHFSLYTVYVAFLATVSLWSLHV